MLSITYYYGEEGNKILKQFIDGTLLGLVQLRIQ